jgi:hypothetical protein
VLHISPEDVFQGHALMNLKNPLNAAPSQKRNKPTNKLPCNRMGLLSQKKLRGVKILRRYQSNG